MNKPTELPHMYHSIVAQIDDDLSNLELNSGTMHDGHRERLLALVDVSKHRKMDISDVDKQFQLVQHLRDMVLNDNGGLRVDSGVKEIASLISSINSLISLFLKAQKEIDAVRETAELKDAVLQAIRGLGVEEQNKFFEVLNNA